MSVTVIDDFLKDPIRYREEALKLEYKTFEFPECTFHGIALGGPSLQAVHRLVERFQNFNPTLTFFRKSPKGQVEPHFIHSDIDMGKWSAVLYLNPNPPAEDGTSFWTHQATGAFGSEVPHERSDEGREPHKYFRLRETVQAKFNRIVVFPSAYFHSRSIHDNWGDGNEARLTQVTFGEFKQ